MTCSPTLRLAGASLRGVALAAALAVASPALAQTVTAPAPEEESAAAPAAPGFDGVPATAELEARRGAVEADATLPADVKSLVLELVTRAIEERGEAEMLAAETTALRALIASAPERIAELKARSEETDPEPAVAADDVVALDELTTRARNAQQALAAARESLAEREKDLAALNALGSTMGEDIASGNAAVRELEQSDKARPAGELPVASEAWQTYLAVRRASLRARVELAELRRSNYETLVRLARLERDEAAVLVPRLDAEREALAKAVAARRAEQARADLEVAQLTAAAAASQPDAVTRLASEGEELSKELETVTLAAAEVAEQRRDTERRANELGTDLASIRERVETVGATEAIGRLLRRSLQALGSAQATRARGREDEIIHATDRRIDLSERRRALADTQARVDALLLSIPEAERAGRDEETLRSMTASLLSANRETIDDLHEAYGRLLTELTSNEAAESSLVATAGAMDEFIRRELLWIPSMPAISRSDFDSASGALSGLWHAATWRQTFEDARGSVVQAPVRSTLAFAIVLGILAFRSRARRRLTALGQLTGRVRTDAFRHTALALLLTAMIASAWPLFFVYLGWQIQIADDAAQFSRQLSEILTSVGLTLVVFSGARWVLRPGGLARRHFGWREAICIRLTRELGWLMPITVICGVFVDYVRTTNSLDYPAARYALIVLSASIAVFDWRVFRRGGPLMTLARERYPDAVGARSWPLWFPVMIAVPAANVIAAVAGYAYTAGIVAELLIQSGELLFGVWVLRDVMLRWFTVAERRLRVERALEAREEARAERERQQLDGSDPALGEMVEIEEPQLDFRELGNQGRAVVQGAVLIGVLLSLWAMWGDLLPALTTVGEVHLPLSRAELVDGVQQQIPVTAIDALVAVLAVLVTLFAAKNLSGLLGFTVLRRLQLDPGAQYAIVALCQYALVATGVLYAFSAFGMQWSKLQWLVAALGVGLGFGLQEIVANFVSGIILLLERPVRVGDIVTVGGATGTVTRIRIRATTILDLDRKELVLPNKEFITGTVLNWTLSSHIVRVIIPVGIAYGTNARRARELMLEAGLENEHVLEEPEPNVVFASFGDNALCLELRVYVPSMEHYLLAITTLHDAIYEKFTESGIVISFPQRDVHLDAGTLDVRVVNAQDDGRPGRRWWRGPPGVSRR